MFIAKNNDLIILAKETKEELEQALKFMVYTSIEETDINYELYNGEYLTKKEIAQYEIRETQTELQAWGYTQEEIEQLEREKINNLTCTKRVFALALQKLGITYTQLKEIISTNEQAQLEWDLCEKLERSNPLIDIMGEKYGLKTEDIDAIFIKANM